MAKNFTTAMQQGILVFLSCLLSAGLLVVSFPRLELSFLAWVALVPLLCILDGKKEWRAFRRAYLCGFLFFAAAIGWVCYVTYIGAFLLVAFLALYFALFGVAFVFFQRRLKLIPRLFVLAAVWVALEYIRSHFLSGFGWVKLGHTQYKNLWLIQIADKTGIYGVSYLVMLVNLLVFETVKARSLLPRASMIVGAIIAVVLTNGWWTMGHTRQEGEVKVGVVQPDISLADDWDEARKPWIIGKTVGLTQAFSDKKLDLIVWPETSLPGVFTDAPFLTYEIRATAAGMHTPIVMGSIDQEGRHYYNSAFYIGTDGQVLGHYDKIHLVPFGEFLPLRPILGWIDQFVPLEDFTPGTKYKVFSLGGQKNFSVLICFEDTLGSLCRHFALAGADFFVNITNDAWFEQTRAPYLHLQGAVFSCVENHRALARAANTGVSALIDPWGRMLTTVTNGKGRKIFVTGSTCGTLPLVHEKTFYTKYGDVFTWACFLCIVVATVIF
ncbi:MAG: apolipoprotein N-acyltransferase [Candidatus Omnitrophica bacterium]|nr:apolipoprotein N-acyltransferase [Candidatus Omnitrophota bacterium]